MITADIRFDESCIHRKTFAPDEACNHARCYHEYMTQECRSPESHPVDSQRRIYGEAPTARPFTFQALCP
jgi:hypothetical protein